jgi:hypothetical protein
LRIVQALFFRRAVPREFRANTVHLLFTHFKEIRTSQLILLNFYSFYLKRRAKQYNILEFLVREQATVKLC